MPGKIKQLSTSEANRLLTNLIPIEHKGKLGNRTIKVIVDKFNQFIDFFKTMTWAKDQQAFKILEKQIKHIEKVLDKTEFKGAEGEKLLKIMTEETIVVQEVIRSYARNKSEGGQIPVIPGTLANSLSSLVGKLENKNADANSDENFV